MTTLHVPIDRSSGTPLYRQIFEEIRRAILDRRLRPGQRMPSTRALATDLGVSRLPVLMAYDQLLHEGYAEGRIGSGTYVSTALPDDFLQIAPLGDDLPHSAPVRGDLTQRTVPPDSSPRAARLSTRRTLDGREDSGELKPFRINLPALDHFPRAAWSRLVSRHAEGLSPSQMAYGSPAGLAELRAAVAERLRAARAVRCETDQVIIVSGSQAALRIAATVLLEPGEHVAVEEPGYPGARNALAAGGATLVSVPVDDEGMSVASLEDAKGRLSVVHVTPSHQYPLGVSMSAGRRLMLLDWALRKDAWILEDDYDSDYRYVSRPLGALQGMDANDRVIYIGTFSKVLFPAIRVGYLVVPRALLPRFLEARAAFDLFSPTLYQAVLAEFLLDGHFERHIRRMRGVYARRRKALLDGLTRDCADHLSVKNADAGLHLTALLPSGVDDVVVVRRMNERGLTATALSSCYAGPIRRSGLLLGFGGFPESRLYEASQVLGGILSEALYGRFV